MAAGWLETSPITRGNDCLCAHRCSLPVIHCRLPSEWAIARQVLCLAAVWWLYDQLRVFFLNSGMIAHLLGDSTCQYRKNRDISVMGSMYVECVRRCNLMCMQLYEKDTTSPATIAVALLSRHDGHSKSSIDDICDRLKVKCWELEQNLCLTFMYVVIGFVMFYSSTIAGFEGLLLLCVNGETVL